MISAAVAPENGQATPRGGRMKFREKLRELRKTAGLSQPKLAERSGVALAAIRNYEQGQRESPSWVVILRLARGLGVSADVFAECDEVAEDEPDTPTPLDTPAQPTTDDSLVRPPAGQPRDGGGGGGAKRAGKK
jgi:transcriptional regulator with XRE-family HTH domain